MMDVEAAWSSGDNDKLLKVLDEQWESRSFPPATFLFVDFARESEDRAWPLFREWIRGKLRKDSNWRETVSFARNSIELYNGIRNDLITQGKYDVVDRLIEKSWQITIEEGDTYLKELSGN